MVVVRSSTVGDVLAAVMDALAAQASNAGREGMARYGINVADAFGVSVYELRRIAKTLGTDHELSEAQMDAWAGAFDSWDVCDQVTSNLFDKTPFAYAKVDEWSAAEDEWVKRAAFATAAALAVQDKAAGDERFLPILALVAREAGDGRNFVKKAVNWALRNIGKRNPALHAAALSAPPGARSAGTVRTESNSIGIWPPRMSLRAPVEPL